MGQCQICIDVYHALHYSTILWHILLKYYHILIEKKSPVKGQFPWIRFWPYFINSIVCPLDGSISNATFLLLGHFSKSFLELDLFSSTIFGTSWINWALSFSFVPRPEPPILTLDDSWEKTTYHPIFFLPNKKPSLQQNPFFTHCPKTLLLS